MNRTFSLIVLIAFLTCSSDSVMGQASVSSMSSSALRTGITLRHDEIRVEELRKTSNAIRRSAKLVESGKYEKANRLLGSALTFVRNRFESGTDVGVDRVCEIAMQQRKNVQLIRKSSRSID